MDIEMERVKSRGILKKKLIYTIAFLSIICCARRAELPQYKWGIDPNSLPRVVEETDFPKLEFGSADRNWGLAGKDLTQKDLKHLSLIFLARQTFDQNTRWPRSNNLPKGFSPGAWLRAGKDPGLGIQELHSQGVDGKGVSIAVIDKPMRPSHNECKKRISYYEVFENEKEGLKLHFHGIACTSILAGKTVGVAPEAKIFYFATPDRGKNFHFYSIAVNKIIDINRHLNNGDKIRLVSISDGFGKDDPYRREWDKAVEKLHQEKIDVIYSTRELFNDFIWGGCPPFLDRNIASNYDVALYFKEAHEPLPSVSEIMVPGDYRTTASNFGDEAYIYWGGGGYSWAIPYLAGLAALAWQLDPLLSLDEIKGLLRASAVESNKNQLIISPIRFIKLVRESKRKQWAGKRGRGF